MLRVALRAIVPPQRVLVQPRIGAGWKSRTPARRG